MLPRRDIPKVNAMLFAAISVALTVATVAAFVWYGQFLDIAPHEVSVDPEAVRRAIFPLWALGCGVIMSVLLAIVTRGRYRLIGILCLAALVLIVVGSYVAVRVIAASM